MAKGVGRAIRQPCSLECLVKRHVDMFTGNTFRVGEYEIGCAIGMPSKKHLIHTVAHVQNRLVLDLRPPQCNGSAGEVDLGPL